MAKGQLLSASLLRVTKASARQAPTCRAVAPLSEARLGINPAYNLSQRASDTDG